VADQGQAVYKKTGIDVIADKLARIFHGIYIFCWFLGSQSAGDLVINPVVGWRYFPPGHWLLSRPKRSPAWLVPNYTVWWQRHTGVCEEKSMNDATVSATDEVEILAQSLSR